MPDPTNDLRAFAMHQKSKEPPEVPRITWQQATVLRLAHLDIGERAMIEADLELQGFLAESDPDGELGEMLSLGRAALANFEAEREREIRAPLEALIRKLHDRCGSVSCAACEGMWMEPLGPYQHNPGCLIAEITGEEVTP